MPTPVNKHANDRSETEKISKAPTPSESQTERVDSSSSHKMESSEAIADPSLLKTHSSGRAEYLGLAGETASLGAANTGVISGLAGATAKAFSYLGPVGFIIGMGIDVIKIPWKCYKERRAPTLEEGTKLAISLGSIALSVAAIVVPPLMGFLLIGAAVGAVALNVIGYNANKRELVKLNNSAYQLETNIRKEVQQLESLEKKIQSRQLAGEDSKDLSELMISSKNKITAFKTQYMQEKQQVHELKKKINHPVLSFFNTVKSAMSAVSLVGLIIAPFIPVVGLVVLAVAGCVSVAAFGGAEIVNKFGIKPEEIKNISSPKVNPKTPEKDTIKELDEPQITRQAEVALAEGNKSNATASEDAQKIVEAQNTKISADDSVDNKNSLLEETPVPAWHHNLSPIHHELSQQFNEEEALAEEKEIKQALHHQRDTTEYTSAKVNTESEKTDEKDDEDDEDDEFEMPK